MYPKWDNGPDYIVLRVGSLSDRSDLEDLEGYWVDRSKMPFLETAAELHGYGLEPQQEFEVSDEGSIAQVWQFRPL